MHTKYAVVIVTCNRESLLEECIGKVNNQTVSADCIIIVNNASEDGTRAYLEKINDSRYDIIHLEKNIGGAGGFAKGIERAAHKDIECVLVIDDDAMLEEDYMEKLLKAREKYSDYKAFAGTVKVNNRIDTFHRRMISRLGLFLRKCGEEKYNQPYFECEIASFCGMLINVELVKQIGLPHAEYFIWHDDAEYSLRIKEYSKFLVITDAVLNHKTKINNGNYPRRYDWREYYAVRNRILMVKEHGSPLDRIINNIDLFIHVVFRNWLFALLKYDHYDWKYECELVKRAIHDGFRGRTTGSAIKSKRK